MPANIVTTSTGGIALDYSVYLDALTNTATNYAPYLDRIAKALETIATLSTSTGIRTNGPYDWAHGIGLYNWYIQQGNPLNPSLTTSTQTTDMLSAVNTVTSIFPRYL
jgi:hypothetical protein